jgi:hypothetical protein
MSDADETAAHELALYIDNDSYMYKRAGEFVKSVKAKIKAGKYDASKAPKLWQHYVDEGARRYMKEYGSGKLQDVFNKATRESLAKQYARHAYEEIRMGRL